MTTTRTNKEGGREREREREGDRGRQKENENKTDGKRERERETERKRDNAEHDNARICGSNFLAFCFLLARLLSCLLAYLPSQLAGSCTRLAL